MPRSSSKGASSSSNKTCPPNKFSVGIFNGCMSWSTILAIITLCALLVISSLIVINKNSKNTITINGNTKKYNDNDNNDDDDDNNEHIKMIKNNIANNISMKHKNIHERDLEQLQPLQKLQPEQSIYDGIDKQRSVHNNTGTPTSERIQYDINVNIRDVENNRNTMSYGQNGQNGENEYVKNIDRIINPLLPPERSYVNTYGIPINIPSRGPQQTYQQVGVLYKDNIENTDKQPGNNNESNILPLYGRPSYSGSNRWNYYTSSDKFNAIKLPISIDGRKCTDTTGCAELMNNDLISLPSYNGKFKVDIYNIEQPRYIPNVY